MQAYVWLLLVLIGLVLFCVPKLGPKVNEAGRIMYAAGLIGAVLHFAGRVARVL